MKFGYACINLGLASEKVQVNRSMVKRTFQEKGIRYASQLAFENFRDLEKIINWNISNNFLLYRMSSDMVPWMSEYEIADLPDFSRIQRTLKRTGEKIKAAGMRLTFHPGPFNVLASNNPDVITKTIKELRQHAEIMDMLGLPETAFAKINIHVGGAYGDKTSALARFAENYLRLPENTRKRLTVENDDKANLFSIKDLLWLQEQTRIPLVFDYFHHQFGTGGLSEEEALIAAASTWPENIRPIVHFSSPKKHHEDPKANATAHADFVYTAVNNYGIDFDVMLEAKGKEEAVLRYLREFGINK